MYLSINGKIDSGNIDARNWSSNAESEINLKGAELKATKAVKGNDGNIWLTSLNNIIVEDAKMETVNLPGAENTAGGNVQLLAGQKVSVGTTDIDAVGNVDFISQGNDIVVDKTTIDTPKATNATTIIPMPTSAYGL